MASTEVYRYVFELGISPKHKGFHYICEVLDSINNCAPSLFDIEVAFTAVSLKFGIGRHSMERNMRYAVQFAWNTQESSLQALISEAARKGLRISPNGSTMGGMPGLAGSAGAYRILNRGRPPSLAEFICSAAWGLPDWIEQCGRMQRDRRELRML